MTRLATWLFSLTSLLSAALLFAVQPLVGKMVLPIYGGSPSVWNTCMVFFQLLLLGGYLYSHLAVTHLGFRAQAALHVALLTIALLALPIALSSEAAQAAAASGQPVFSLLALLLAMAALPYFVVSAASPMLQAWFARLDHPDADEPYFLYAASNLGSLAALLAYPLAIEPLLRVSTQSSSWAAGFAALVLAMAACAALVLRMGRDVVTARPRAVVAAPPVRWGQRLRWVLLACIPSSLVLGVTTYLTTDLGSLPLLWVVPLALYLATFVLAFSRWSPPESMLRRIATVATVCLAFVFLVGATQPMWLVLTLHLAAFFVLALYCHTTLAGLRPPAARLTDFYLALSIGGVLGGAFNAFVAPHLFSNVLEYPLVAVAVLAIRPLVDPAERLTRRDLVAPALLGGATAGLGLALSSGALDVQHVAGRLLVGLPVIGCYFLATRPARFALGAVLVVAAAAATFQFHGRTLHVARNFYGTSRVTIDPSDRFVQLVHGNTVHGRRLREEPEAPIPLTYFHPHGPAGQLFRVFNASHPSGRVAVVGLGTGSMAHYAAPGQRWRYYEIDPLVVDIARDRGFFPFLSQSAATSLDVVLGDARIRIREAPDHHYDLIAIDAFSSDSIPAHLVTREAVELYRRKLAEDGLIAFHISNRYFDLRPVLARIGAELELARAVIVDEPGPDWAERYPGREPSLWVLLAPPSALFDRLIARTAWAPLPLRDEAPLWTDDYSSALRILRWN